MSNYESLLLKDIVTITAGYTVRSKVVEDPSGDMSILQKKDVRYDTGISWTNLTRMNQVGKRKPTYLKQEDVVFSGRGTRIFAAPVEISPTDVAATHQFFVLSPIEQSLSAVYLSWYINSKGAQRYFWTNAGGTSIINVTLEVLGNLPVPVPSQKDIMTITNLIKAINKEEELSHQLKMKRQKLLESIISKGMEE